jgi:hypothetical protein
VPPFLVLDGLSLSRSFRPQDWGNLLTQGIGLRLSPGLGSPGPLGRRSLYFVTGP